MANFTQSRFPALPPVIKYLIIVNVIVWLIEYFSKSSGFVDYFALHDFRSSHFKPHQLISHLFLHDPLAIWHLLFNMFALWMFGSTLENYWGSKRFFNFYMICGIGAGILYLVAIYFLHMGEMSALAEFQAHPSNELFNEIISKYLVPESVYYGLNDSNSIYSAIRNFVLDDQILGASGAIFGVLVAFGYTFPNTEMIIIPIPFPVKAKYLVGGYVLLELYTGFRNSAGDNVAHFAHLGGALVGFLLVVFWNKTNKRDFY